MTGDVDVVVVGAGVAGLAAAACLRAAGRRCLVLEAAGRIGGRAWTTHPPALGGVAVDHGATWLHAAEHNPLVPLARAAGVALQDAFATRIWRTRIGDRWATDAELAAYERAEARFTALLRTRAAAGPDISLLAAARALPPDPDTDPWIATVLAWESSVIAAADAAELGLCDWAANLLDAAAARAAGPACVVTDWGSNTLTLGAYAYAPPGRAGARTALGAPFWDGRLRFAGEACHVGLAGTVAGAFLSGRQAAEAMLALKPEWSTAS